MSNDVERESNGQFAKGNKVGQGYGRRTQREEDLRVAVLSQETTPEKWRAICAKAIEDAIDGLDGRTRERGRRFIAEYLIGKPNQAITINAGWRDPFAEWDNLSDAELRQIANGGHSAGSADDAPDAAPAGGAGSAGASSPD